MSTGGIHCIQITQGHPIQHYIIDHDKHTSATTYYALGVLKAYNDKTRRTVATSVLIARWIHSVTISIAYAQHEISVVRRYRNQTINFSGSNRWRHRY